MGSGWVLERKLRSHIVFSLLSNFYLKWKFMSNLRSGMFVQKAQPQPKKHTFLIRVQMCVFDNLLLQWSYESRDVFTAKSTLCAKLWKNRVYKQIFIGISSEQWMSANKNSLLTLRLWIFPSWIRWTWLYWNPKAASPKLCRVLGIFRIHYRRKWRKDCQSRGFSNRERKHDSYADKRSSWKG